MKFERIRFTKHASAKFEFLKKCGFDVSQELVRDTVPRPSRLDQKDDQILVVKPLDDEFALRVVYKRMNDNIVVVTFHPV